MNHQQNSMAGLDGFAIEFFLIEMKKYLLTGGVVAQRVELSVCISLCSLR